MSIHNFKKSSVCSKAGPKKRPAAAVAQETESEDRTKTYTLQDISQIVIYPCRIAFVSLFEPMCT